MCNQANEILARNPASVQLPPRSFYKHYPLCGHTKQKQMPGATAIGRAKTLHTSARLISYPRCPGTLQLMGIFDHQRAGELGLRQQIVDVPVAAAGARCVTPKPRRQPARSQRATDVAIKAHLEADGAVATDLQFSRRGERQQEHVCARRAVHDALHDWLSGLVVADPTVVAVLQHVVTAMSPGVEAAPTVERRAVDLHHNACLHDPANLPQPVHQRAPA